MITYFVDNKLGGVTSLNYNLCAHAPEQSRQCVIHIDLKESDMAKANTKFPVQKEIQFSYSNRDNYYHTLKRLYQLVDPTAGALVLNYDTEMAMLDHYPVKQTTYQLVHDDYNVGLAKKYGHVVDVFIAHNTVIYQKLLECFPGRKSDVFYLPHGVPIPQQSRQESTGVIKLLFLGRMAKAKGVYDLPEINSILRRRGVSFEWTCIGNGPELNELKRLWNPEDKVKFLSPTSNEEVMAHCSTCDVFVLPTKFEGSPVSLLETMSVGLVPVITRIPGGVTDIVGSDFGFAIDMDNNEAFAEAIMVLDKDRALLNKLSHSCREKIIHEFDVKKTASAYHDLFHRFPEFYKPKEIRRSKVGARLDQPYLPSGVTRFLRSL